MVDGGTMTFPMTAMTRDHGDSGDLKQKWVFSSNTRYNYFPLI
jgi:hypothetical protein